MLPHPQRRHALRSVITVIKAAIGNLEAVTSRIKPKGVKLPETKILVLPNPRFAKDHLENLRARAGSINRSER
jgi:hypothetical protein